MKTFLFYLINPMKALDLIKKMIVCRFLGPCVKKVDVQSPNHRMCLFVRSRGENQFETASANYDN